MTKELREIKKRLKDGKLPLKAQAQYVKEYVQADYTNSCSNCIFDLLMTFDIDPYFWKGKWPKDFKRHVY